ncbi:hypothetical protein [Paenibacillus turpanensis]|uniref:hypothetical protein n=1 Tax=Paenibacillus turpanensis TaxID=2689078 RepID=UPI001FB6F475|nr:hypothetical protein [Paenibacillus turpanensis]
MPGESLILRELQAFAEEKNLEVRQGQKEALISNIVSSGEAQTVASYIVDCLTNAVQSIGEKGFAASLDDPDLVADWLEIAYGSLHAEADFTAYMPPLARLLVIERKERDKSKAELYVQYRAAALMDELLALDVPLSEEAQSLLQKDYFISDVPTEEVNSQIWWRMADRGIDISRHIPTLITLVQNDETPTLANNCILALWAAVRGGFFDSPIPNSEKTYNVWLWSLVTCCVTKLRSRYEETTRLGAVGCLLEASQKYPQTQSLILECMEKWGIKEPKRPRGDFQLDLRD